MYVFYRADMQMADCVASRIISIYAYRKSINAYNLYAILGMQSLLSSARSMQIASAPHSHTLYAVLSVPIIDVKDVRKCRWQARLPSWARLWARKLFCQKGTALNPHRRPAHCRNGKFVCLEQSWTQPLDSMFKTLYFCRLQRKLLRGLLKHD